MANNRLLEKVEIAANVSLDVLLAFLSTYWAEVGITNARTLDNTTLKTEIKENFALTASAANFFLVSKSTISTSLFLARKWRTLNEIKLNKAEMVLLGLALTASVAGFTGGLYSLFEFGKGVDHQVNDFNTTNHLVHKQTVWSGAAAGAYALTTYGLKGVLDWLSKPGVQHDDKEYAVNEGSGDGVIFDQDADSSDEDIYQNLYTSSSIYTTYTK